MENRDFAPVDVSLMEDELWTLAVKINDLHVEWNRGQVNETGHDPQKFSADLTEAIAVASERIVKILERVS
jgi:hypothetical protein